jgi:hypothetical protein
VPGVSVRVLRGALREAVHTAAPFGRGGDVADGLLVLQMKIQSADGRAARCGAGNESID